MRTSIKKDYCECTNKEGVRAHPLYSYSPLQLSTTYLPPQKNFLVYIGFTILPW